jgi:hypothetical protein
MKLLWGLASVGLASVDGLAIFLLPTDKINIDWRFGLIAGACIALSGLVWLASAKHLGHGDWSKPYSWQMPFIPMSKYPFRFWFVVTSCLAIGSAIATGLALLLEPTRVFLGVTFLLMGLCPLLAICAWQRIFGGLDRKLG